MRDYTNLLARLRASITDPVTGEQLYFHVRPDLYVRDAAEAFVAIATLLHVIAKLTEERDAAVREAESLRELLNCYNLGGWTDAERLMKERDAAVKDALRWRMANRLRLVTAEHVDRAIREGGGDE